MKNTRGFIAEDRPELIKEWHITENKSKTPYNIRTGSDKYIIWRCKECSHVWTTQAKNRAIHNTGCPKCHERYNVAFPELAIYYYIKQIFKDAQLNSDIQCLGKYKSVDVLIGSLNLVIEYDGGYTHREKYEIDHEKSRLIIANGYNLIRVRDNGLAPLKIEGVYEYLYERKTKKAVNEMIKQVLLMIKEQQREYGKDIDRIIEIVNVDIDTISILSQIPPIIEKENLLESYPKVKQIWDYDRNYPLRPEHFKPHSNFKVWFTCEQGHTTLTQINSKTKGHGCKVCQGQVATEDYNFELLFPEIAREWNHELNISTPDMYLPFSNEVVYWICPKCKSTYDKMINDRTGNGENCPYCAGKRVNNTNSLAVLRPDLAKEWHPIENQKRPDEVTLGSHYLATWICKRGHIYPCYVYSSVEGKGCKKCYEEFGRFQPHKVPYEKSIAKKKPFLLAQWDYEKNDILPEETPAYARQKVWWKCSNGCSWSQEPNTRNSSRCKICRVKD